MGQRRSGAAVYVQLGGAMSNRPPKNICDFCDRPVVVTVVGKGTWGYRVDSQGKIARYAHASCIYGLQPPPTDEASA